MSARFSSDPFCPAGSSPRGGHAQRTGGSRPSQGTPALGLASAPAAIAPAQEDAIYCPDHYERNYAYPLLVWLTGEEAPPDNLNTLMRRVSERNCFGLAVRRGAGIAPAETIFGAVTALRRQYHIHSERIYLAGRGELASLALAVGLARPEWFAGIVAVAPDLGGKRTDLARFDALRGKRVLLATTETPLLVEATQRMRRLLWTAGMSVHAVTCAGAAETDAGVLREIDRWMLQGIEDPCTSGFPA